MADKSGSNPKFYLPDSQKGQIVNALHNQGIYFPDQVDSIITSLQNTGKLPDTIPTTSGVPMSVSGIAGLQEAVGALKPYAEGLQQEVDQMKSNLSNLDSSGIQKYIDLVTRSNQADPGAQEEQKQKFKKELLSLHGTSNTSLTQGQAEDVAEKAAQRFIVERKTGEQSLVDFVYSYMKTHLPDSNPNIGTIRGQLSPLQDRLGEFLNVPGQVKGQQQTDLTEANKLLSERKASEAQAQRQAQQDQLAQQQYAQAQTLLGDTLKTLQAPNEAFSSDLNKAALEQLQGAIRKQGETALQNVQAQEALRGLTGSSIEASALSQTQANISDVLAQQTLNFLLQSGVQGERNKEFIIQTLANQANTLLSAGQGSQALGAQTNISQQGIDLQRQQLQNQILQFNQQFQEAQRQFNTDLDFKQRTAEQDMQLLLQRLGHRRGGSFLDAGLGMAATGATIGGLSAGAPGAGIGAGAGFLAGLTSYYANPDR